MSWVPHAKWPIHSYLAFLFMYKITNEVTGQRIECQLISVGNFPNATLWNNCHSSWTFNNYIVSAARFLSNEAHIRISHETLHNNFLWPTYITILSHVRKLENIYNSWRFFLAAAGAGYIGENPVEDSGNISPHTHTFWRWSHSLSLFSHSKICSKSPSPTFHTFLRHWLDTI